MQSLTSVTFTVYEKIATLKFLPCWTITRSVSQKYHHLDKFMFLPKTQNMSRKSFGLLLFSLWSTWDIIRFVYLGVNGLKWNSLYLTNSTPSHLLYIQNVFHQSLDMLMHPMHAVLLLTVTTLTVNGGMHAEKKKHSYRVNNSLSPAHRFKVLNRCGV